MGHRRNARELAMQALFSVDLRENNLLKKSLLKDRLPEKSVEDESIQCFCENFKNKLSKNTYPYFHTLLDGVKKHKNEIDKLIEKHSNNWKIARMSYVDRNIMRIAGYELLFCPDIPSKVSINEAVDIGKKFGTFESGSFVNGILDSIKQSL